MSLQKAIIAAATYIVVLVFFLLQDFQNPVVDVL